MSQKNSGYVSEIDQFLQVFDKQHPQLSDSQKQEKMKYQRIHYLRSTANRPNDVPHLDDWF